MIVKRFLQHPDSIAVLVLLLLWGGFFWRLLTPTLSDQASLAEGDFSGQFVAFGAYQAVRLWQGEVPLWDPYNNGGLPFLADTQSAVFYPPRLLTVFLTRLAGEWTFHALELEMMAHVLAASLLMYLLVRRLTWDEVGSVPGALAAALAWAYGGFMAGYPPLQLALLEAAIWGPLILLGIHEATRGERLGWSCLALSGLALGLCFLAGHPQTAWFMAYLLLGFLGYRAYQRRYGWRAFLLGAALVGISGVALAAVQLLPAFEYLQHTTRIGFGFEAKSNGFPVQDVLQVLFPGLFSQFSPLYVGIAGLVLAAVALWQRAKDAAFWGGAALIALLLSLGANTAFYGVLYTFLPGLGLFRGQERAAVVIALALAVLAGQGMARLASGQVNRAALLRVLLVGLAAVGIVAGLVFVGWLGDAEAFSPALAVVSLALLLSTLTVLAVGWLLDAPANAWQQGVLIALLALDLFTVAQGSGTFEPVPPSERLPRPAQVDVIQAQDDAPPYRVDGRRGLLANYGSLWQVPDVRGISPLWLAGPHAIIQEALPQELAWELFAVKYVLSDWEELPIPAQVIGQGEDGYGPVNVHELDDPRPFALLMQHADLVDSDAFAYALLASPDYDLRHSIILLDDGSFTLPDEISPAGTAEVVEFAPERIEIAISGQDGPGLLSLALPEYPGWQATVDGAETPILRAYGALSAVVLPADAHNVTLIYAPLSFTLGAIISLLAWIGIAGYAVVIFLRARRA